MDKLEKIRSLGPWDIVSVYKGRDGECCCGCAGTHTYNPGFKEIAGESRGYEVDEEEINFNTVKRILNKIKKHADEADDGGGYISYATPGGKRWSRRYGWRPTKGTLYIAYLAPTLQEIEEMRERRKKSAQDRKIQAEEAVKGAGI